MTAYIANHQKKLRILSKREAALKRAIDQGLDEFELLVLAHLVREAKMSVFKCEYTKNSPNQPSTFYPEREARTNRRIRRWLDLTLTEIVEIYRVCENPPR
ncbi:hypothetical protein KOR34_35080 [Posidoniimonas corsicana]|uniref:Uncharacterized protein n=1 Tax=Posidoniimonas corsicana TaxID=1938618 RepID=A0A5C5V7E7_9BACT|nr:hypothetical protein [Posidoniimonas corsicana]TWT33675.1 hypothetical protein KOR34_35080 [Posidoniimonas corsicana]